MNPADEARIDWAEYSAAEMAAYDADNPDESDDYGDGPRVWVTLHELSGDLASGPFETYEAAKVDQAGFDDVYPSRVPRAWFEWQRAALAAEREEASRRTAEESIPAEAAQTPAEWPPDLIDRAAKAAIQIFHPRPHPMYDWESTTEAYRQVWRDIARAVIWEAVEEPEAVIEILDESQPWPIPLPNVDVYAGRVLEAREANGSMVARWRPLPDKPEWRRVASPFSAGMCDSFAYIVSMCMEQRWRLFSIPRTEEPGR